MNKKVLSVALVVLLLMALVFGASYAYFTDSKTITNVFTVGKGVSLELKEDTAAVSQLSLLGGTQTESGASYNNVLPGQKYHKEPTVKVTSDVKAYVAVTIQITERAKLANLFNIQNDNWLALFGANGLLCGELAAYPQTQDLTILADAGLSGVKYAVLNGEAVLTYVLNSDDSVTLNLFFTEEQAKDTSHTLFQYVNIPGTLTQSDSLSGFHVTVNAYAVQTEGFTNVWNAMHTAFADKFAKAGESAN